MEKLTLYHGSIACFELPDLSKARDKRDFGKGFYTTFFRKQAEQWAKAMQLRFGEDVAYVYEYTFESSANLHIKEFPDLTLEWLEMIKENRINGDIQHDFDIVIGPVANDKSFRTVALYLEGDYTAEQAIERLRFPKPNNQVSLHTSKAIAQLKFVRRQIIGE